jgi:thiosulfate/3-mercaptopyruvate sulfurtransferase
MRAGHIPGAVHLHASANLNPSNWTYLSVEALQARAQAAGVKPEQRVITYCGVGISASLGLFALYLAGYRRLALYDASWEEWGTDPSLPVVREFIGRAG